MFFPLTAKPAARLLLLAASLLATQQALALTPANPWQQHPTCQHVAANTCIDSPGSFAPPVTGSATLSGPPAQSQASALAKKRASTAVTASSGGVVYFVDTNQTINQMFYNGTQWVDINLMTSSQSGVHVALGTDVTVDINGFVYYVDTGGTIHQMWWAGSQWVDAFLMASSQSGTTVQPGSNVTVDSVGSVYYVSSGQTVHKMWWGNSEGRWLDADLMASSQSGFQVEAFTGVTVDSSYSIYYVGTGLTIHKMWFQGSQFVDADLMASSQSGYNVQPGSQVTVDANFNIYYVTTAQAVHQMYWGTNQFVDVSIHNSLLVEPGTGVTVDTSGSVYYVDTGQTVHKMYISGGQWVDANIMASAQSASVVVPGGGVAVDGNGNIYYVDPGQTINEMFWVGTQFADANLMASSGSGLQVSVAFIITGQIASGGAGLNGVSVTLNGTTPSGAAVSQTTTTATVNGNVGEYSFLVADGGIYTVTPSLSGYIFSPSSQATSANQTENFAAGWLAGEPPLSNSDSGATPDGNIQGISVVSVANGQVSTYSATELDYTAQLYYAAYSVAGLYDGGQLIQIQQTGFDSGTAQLSLSSPANAWDDYTLQTDHYAVAYLLYQDVYENPLYYEGYSSGEDSSGDLVFGPGGGAFYIVSDRIYLGSTLSEQLNVPQDGSLLLADEQIPQSGVQIKIAAWDAAIAAAWTAILVEHLNQPSAILPGMLQVVGDCEYGNQPTGIATRTRFYRLLDSQGHAWVNANPVVINENIYTYSGPTFTGGGQWGTHGLVPKDEELNSGVFEDILAERGTSAPQQYLQQFWANNLGLPTGFVLPLLPGISGAAYPLFVVDGMSKTLKGVFGTLADSINPTYVGINGDNGNAPNLYYRVFAGSLSPPPLACGSN